MKNNAEIISSIIDYIEDHMTEEISLDDLAYAAGYSKYHLHRMFTSLVGFSVHQYINRRRLTEAARKLLFTDNSIIEIALETGYESQQAFTLAFKKSYKSTPQSYRNKHEFCPIQLKFKMEGNFEQLKGDRIMDIKIVDSKNIYLVGYRGNTKKGFFVLPRLWHKLHKVKNQIKNRTCQDYTVGLNDYSKYFTFEDKQPAFDYYAAVEVSDIAEVPSKMSSITLPAGKYAVFNYCGRAKDSIQPVMEYIYKEWFPQSNYQMNEYAKYDFTRYGEITDDKNESNIEVWIPITSYE